MFSSACLCVSVLILSSAIGMVLQESSQGSKEENIPKRVRRIVNGTEINRNSRPYLVYVSIDDIACGGTIFDEYTIVTAAHCIPNDFKEAKVLAGAHSITTAENDDSNVQKISFSRENVTVHGSYDNITYDNDIAILSLQTPLNLTSGTVQCLTVNSNASCPAVGDSCSVAGWGLTKTNGNSSDVPLQVDIKVKGSNNCGLQFTPNITILAGGDEGKDSCQGDSGGPFVCSCGGRNTFSGIVSYGGLICGEPGCPGVYTRVSFFLNWINDNRKSRGNNLTECVNAADTEIKTTTQAHAADTEIKTTTQAHAADTEIKTTTQAHAADTEIKTTTQAHAADTEIKTTTQAHGSSSHGSHLLTIFSLQNVIIMLATSIIV